MRVWQAAAACDDAGERAAVATVIEVGGSTPRHLGAKMLVRSDGTVVGTIGGGALEHRAVEAALEVIRTGAPSRLALSTRDLGMACGGVMEVWVEPIGVRPALVVFGAGHVAEATAPLFLALDFDVTVVDDRAEFATTERFPGCTVHCVDPVEFARELEGGPQAHWLIVTYQHRFDQDLAELLLPRDFAWLGMIASRRKVARFREHFREQGLDEALFERLSAPVGLDIGAETPAEIAVAIAAEVVRLRRRATGAPLPLSEGARGE